MIQGGCTHVTAQARVCRELHLTSWGSHSGYEDALHCLTSLQPYSWYGGRTLRQTLSLDATNEVSWALIVLAVVRCEDVLSVAIAFQT